MKFDEVLAEVGEYGPYQRRVYYLACLPAVLSAFHTLLPVFILGIPQYRCRIPGLPNDTYEIQNEEHGRLINISIPAPAHDEEGPYAHCAIYDKFDNDSWNEYITITNETKHITCSSWVYDRTSFYPTAITQFEMVCGNEILRSHSNMLTFGGALTGALVLGLVTDIIGRKKTLMMAVALQLVSGIGVAFAPDFIVFAVFKFISGIASIGSFMIAFVIGMEIVGPTKRTFVGLIIEYFWCAGLMILSGAAYLIRDWRYLQLSLTLPAALFFVFWWVLPESPRWLLTQGRVAEAEVIIRKIAKSNGVHMRNDLMSEIIMEDGPRANITAMFTSPVLLLRCVIIFFNWLAINIIYYGLGLNVGNLSGNVYLNFVLSSLVEVVAYTIVLFVMDRTGRKRIYLASMMLGGIACLATVFPAIYGTDEHKWITVTLSMVGKFGASAAFGVIYVFTAELFPTVLRQSGIGACSIFEGFGGMIAPYIADLGILLGGQFASVLPLIVFGGITVIAGLTSIGLPETQNKKLPETIADAIVFGRNGNEKVDVLLVTEPGCDGCSTMPCGKNDSETSSWKRKPDTTSSCV